MENDKVSRIDHIRITILIIIMAAIAIAGQSIASYLRNKDKWEYKIVTVEGNMSNVYTIRKSEAIMTRLGQQGWELVSAFPVYIFKRKFNDRPEVNTKTK